MLMAGEVRCAIIPMNGMTVLGYVSRNDKETVRSRTNFQFESIAASASSDSVVRRTLEAFDQKRAVAYPGRMSVRLASWSPRLLPRALVVRIIAKETAKMGLHE